MDSKKVLKEATELEWLRYFYENADFGPADYDVIHIMMENFEKKTGKLVPKAYRIGYLEEEEYD